MVLPLKLLEYYVEIMKDIDKIYKGKYFMIQYSLLRYYPDLYDEVVKDDGDIVDVIDYLQLGIDNKFINGEMNNWYFVGGATTQLQEKDKIIVGNTAAQVISLQQAEPLAMKRKLVEYWANNIKEQKAGNGHFQAEIVMHSDNSFTLKNVAGEVIGYYSNKSFSTNIANTKRMSVLENIQNDKKWIQSQRVVSNGGDDVAFMESKMTEIFSDENILYATDDLIVELSEDATLVQVIMKSDYECLLTDVQGEVYTAQIGGNEVQSSSYDKLNSNTSIRVSDEKINVDRAVDLVSEKQSGDSPTNGVSAQDTTTETTTTETLTKKSSSVLANTNSSSKSSGAGGGGSSTSSDIKTAGKEATKAYYIKTGKGTVRYDMPDLDTNAVAVVVPNKVKIGKKEYKVTAISTKAFDGYDKLRSVTIGKNVKKIGKSAFKGCKKLKTIIIQSKKLMKKGVKNSLRDSYIKTIRVPSDMTEKYKGIFKKKNVGSKNEIGIKEK